MCREAGRHGCRARHPFCRSGGACDRCRASLRTSRPHDRRSRGGGGPRPRRRRQQVGPVAHKDKKLKELRDTVAEKLTQVAGVALVTVSALAGRGLERLMREVMRSYEIWNRRVPTGDLNRWLGEALERHPAPAAKGRRVKIRFMTQASARPPTFVAFCTRAEALPQAYLRYLSNSLRQAFDLPGVPIRIKLRRGDNPFAPRRG